MKGLPRGIAKAARPNRLWYAEKRSREERTKRSYETKNAGLYKRGVNINIRPSCCKRNITRVGIVVRLATFGNLQRQLTATRPDLHPCVQVAATPLVGFQEVNSLSYIHIFQLGHFPHKRAEQSIVRTRPAGKKRSKNMPCCPATILDLKPHREQNIFSPQQAKPTNYYTPSCRLRTLGVLFLRGEDSQQSWGGR